MLRLFHFQIGIKFHSLIENVFILKTSYEMFIKGPIFIKLFFTGSRFSELWSKNRVIK
jgi:hypothetical protein